MTKRELITAEDVAADPTNAYQVTVHGDVAIAELSIHGEGRNAWVYIRYANGGSSAGTSKHWHSFVRIEPERESAASLAWRTGDFAEDRRPGESS